MSNRSFIELRAKVIEQLQLKHYADLTISAFKSSYRKLEWYMSENGIEFYDEDVGKSFLRSRHNGKPYALLSNFEKNIIRHIGAINEVLHTGVFSGNHSPRIPKFEYHGDLGVQFNEFLCHERKIKSPHTVTKLHLYLRELYSFLKTKKKNVGELDIPLALRFLSELKQKKCPWHHIISCVRAFILYSCERNLLADNSFARWDKILRLHRPKNPRLPSHYSKEEIEMLLNTIDRSTPKGKRDYVMILLAARYGLRASDITGITFSNFEWDLNRLSLVQAKTGKPISFPLSEEIGNGVIDYIKYGRPDIDSAYVFLEHQAPYRKTSITSLGRSVSYWMLAANIDISKRKHGPHALRHSLATNLFENGEMPSVISEILGHSNSETTLNYLKIDLKHLRQCALEVPLIPRIFYTEIYERENC